jgi:RNA polymerase sigma-70 factor (ECF subfamily)
MHWPSTGDADWEALYADHLPRIYNYFRFRLAGEADVEDLTARTFEKAWSARSRYRRDLAGFSTWLYRIAQNVCVDHLRSRRTHAPLDAAAEVAAERTLETDEERRSDLTRLAALMAALPGRERELIALRYGAGLSNRAIAPLVGLSESNVGTILHRTVQALRSQW